ncbi:hypothetical protein QYE76_040841 [Lolium multiflorum]|uniref:Reverse transcriptase domain-containing protein n=1 Tax=Lolium multiflorum TaxID=4521 RepID=A0AAD8TDJ9_LOLMU|nr:hypothetical protein QYE76_040841 [Lolium multiflorum]
MSSGLRQYLRGWSRNQGAASRREKSALLAQIEYLDARADSLGLEEEEWAERYFLEDQLLHFVREKEEYWQQRGRTKWALQGDTNTAYFHAVANGRRRNCTISSIITPAGPSSDPNIIQQVIYDFYRDLLGSSSQRVCSVAPNIWGEAEKVSDMDNEKLMLTFLEKELEAIVVDMKSNTAHGPDGFSPIFFKRMWPWLKLGVLHILNDFVLGRIDIARLNFGILALISKVPGADMVSQFRPIALINVVFKIVAKAFASWLDPVANKIISPFQTAFIRGRNILEGPVALIEIVHELRVKKLGGILLKLDFEKVYDRVNWGFLEEVLRAKGFDQGADIDKDQERRNSHGARKREEEEGKKRRRKRKKRREKEAQPAQAGQPGLAARPVPGPERETSGRLRKLVDRAADRPGRPRIRPTGRQPDQPAPDPARPAPGPGATPSTTTTGHHHSSPPPESSVTLPNHRYTPPRPHNHRRNRKSIDTIHHRHTTATTAKLL